MINTIHVNEITVKTKIISYEILSIFVVQYISAKIGIVLTSDDNHRFYRTVNLIDQAYTDWTTDDYLSEYIESHILEIFFS